MKYLDIIFFKTWADLRAEASRAYIGFLWWFIEPILYMATFYLLFGLGLRYGGENFVYFLLCGLVPWKWFSSTVSNGSRAIEANAGVIHQVYLPKYILPTITVMINTVKFSIIFPLLLLFLLISDIPLTIHWAGVCVVIALQFLLIWSVTCLLSAVVPFVPDVRYLIENGLLLLMFLSGVFFSIADFSGTIKTILFLNPVAVLIKNYRECLLYGEWPPIADLAYVLVFSLVVAAIAIWLLSRLDRRFAKVL